MQQRYFHAAPILLGEGSTILPGNFLRIRTRFEQDWRKRLLEEVFETVRQREFPALPSRHNSVFLTETLNNAKHFSLSSNRFMDVLYEVELTEDGAPLHRADYNLVNVEAGPQSFEELARNYWGAGSLNCIEILVECPIKIVKIHGPIVS